VDRLQYIGTTVLRGNAAISKNFADGVICTSSCSCCLVDRLIAVYPLSYSLGPPVLFKEYILLFRLFRLLNPLRYLRLRLIVFFKS